jgi:hypothetical protein
VNSYTPNVIANAERHRKEYIQNTWITTQLLTGLQQASQYNCSVRARGKKGYGKAASNLYWTKPSMFKILLILS